jgi:hypothetical protein
MHPLKPISFKKTYIKQANKQGHHRKNEIKNLRRARLAGKKEKYEKKEENDFRNLSFIRVIRCTFAIFPGTLCPPTVY